MKKSSLLVTLALVALGQRPLFAQDPLDTGNAILAEWDGVAGGRAQSSQEGEISDLTLLNFFSAGWTDEWTHRVRETGTPDYALLRVNTNFMEREFRVNYSYEGNINNKSKQQLTTLDMLVAYGLNRRFMIEVLGDYQWLGERTSPNVDGGDPQLIGRIQLIDTEPSSYAFNFKILAPDRGIGQTMTSSTMDLRVSKTWLTGSTCAKSVSTTAFPLTLSPDQAKPGPRGMTSTTTLLLPKRCCLRKLHT